MSTPLTDPSINRVEHDPSTDGKKVSLWYIDSTGAPVRASSSSPLPSSSPPLATRTDSATTTNITYVGKAAIASTSGSAVWQIQKLDKTTADILIITWADGDSNYDNVWDNRAGLSYS